MFKLRSPIVFVKKERKLVSVGCFSCAAVFQVAKENLRVVNYCGVCR